MLVKMRPDASSDEIAAVTGLKEGHVAVLVQRALARLKARLESQGVTHV